MGIVNSRPKVLSLIALMALSASSLSAYHVTIGGSGTACPAPNSGVITADADCSIAVSAVDGNLTAGDLTINTGGAGNITIASGVTITKNAGGDATLTLKSDDAILVDSGVTINSTSNKLNVYFSAMNDDDGTTAVAADIESIDVTTPAGLADTTDDLQNNIVIKHSFNLTTNGGDFIAGGFLDGSNMPSYGNSHEDQPNIIFKANRSVATNDPAFEIADTTINAGAGDIKIWGYDIVTKGHDYTFTGSYVEIFADSNLELKGYHVVDDGGAYLETGHRGLHIEAIDTVLLGAVNELAVSGTDAPANGTAYVTAQTKTVIKAGDNIGFDCYNEHEDDGIDLDNISIEMSGTGNNTLVFHEKKYSGYPMEAEIVSATFAGTPVVMFQVAQGYTQAQAKADTSRFFGIFDNNTIGDELTARGISAEEYFREYFISTTDTHFSLKGGSYTVQFFNDSAPITVTPKVLDNGYFAAGDGLIDSINELGSLRQPFYYDSTVGRWFPLTYDGYDFNLIVGTGDTPTGNASGNWNSHGTILVDNLDFDGVISNIVYDYSGLNSGIGVAKVTYDLGDVNITQAFSLTANGKFLKGTATIGNISGSDVANTRMWVGTEDDWVAITDSNIKTKGNLTANGFEVLANQSDQARAVVISEFDWVNGETSGSAVLFHSTNKDADTVTADDYDIELVYGQDPRASEIMTDKVDGAYGIYMNFGDLPTSQTREVVWYYGVAPVTQLNTLIDEMEADGALDIVTPTGDPYVPPSVQISIGGDNEPCDVSNGTISGSEDCSISAEALSALLEYGAITISNLSGGDANITILEPINWTSNHTLTIKSKNDIHINSDINGSGKLVLEYGQSGGPEDDFQYNILKNVTVSLPSGANFATKKGSSGTTYEYTVINSKADLEAITNGANNVNYALGSSFALDTWTPLMWGGEEGAYAGIFTGLGHTLSNMTINSSTAGTGLFAQTSLAIINHLIIDNSNITGTSEVGTIVGNADSTEFYNVHVQASAIRANMDAGGLVGVLRGNGSKIIRSSTGATMTNNSSFPRNAGGMIGRLTVNTTDITIEDSRAGGEINGAENLGGLIGLASSAGGGKFIIKDVYATTSVQIIAESPAGGLIGLGSDTHVIENVYASGRVRGINVAGVRGGIFGTVNNPGSSTYSNVYWDKNSTDTTISTGSGTAPSSGVTGLNDPDSFKAVSYSGFDFSNRWFMVEDMTRPMLRSEWTHKVSTSHELQLIAMKPSENYVLMNDINLFYYNDRLRSAPNQYGEVWRDDDGYNYLQSGGNEFLGSWAPIGTSASKFSGTLDGGNRSVSSLFIDRAAAQTHGKDHQGLFGYLEGNSTNPAVIKNINVSAELIKAKNFAGTVVGYGKFATLENITAGSRIRESGTDVGGVAGKLENFVAKNIKSNNYNEYMGGIHGTIRVGGAFGSLVSGEVNASSASQSIEGGQKVGGFVGEVSSGVAIDQSYANGSITGSGSIMENIGGFVGFVGFNGGSITKSYATGSVTATDSNSMFLGGFAGKLDMGVSITDSFATGNVTGGSSSQSVGGFIGLLNSQSPITNVYSTGLINATGSFIGGLIGNNLDGTVTRSYWDTQTSGLSTSAGGAGKTTVEMKNIVTFNTTTPAWLIVIDPSLTDVYPQLRWATSGLSEGSSIWVIGSSVTSSSSEVSSISSISSISSASSMSSSSSSMETSSSSQISSSSNSSAGSSSSGFSVVVAVPSGGSSSSVEATITLTGSTQTGPIGTDSYLIINHLNDTQQQNAAETAALNQGAPLGPNEEFVLVTIDSKTGVGLTFTQTATFTIPEEQNAWFTGFWKSGTEATKPDEMEHWFNFGTTAGNAGVLGKEGTGYEITNGGKSLTVYLVDNKDGDKDDTIGIIEDPAALRITTNRADVPQNVVAVPLFGPLGYLLLISAFGLYGARRLKG